MADVTAYDPVFEAAGNEWNVDPQLLKAMAIQESGGNPRAVSKAGALGVMQIMPETAKTLGITDPTDPVQSIYGAAKYMNRALDKEGSVEGALLNYHGGDGWRQAYGPESQGYVPAVTKHYQMLGQFKTALADSNPSVGTDAAPATAPVPAAPTGAGKAMASNDPLSMLPPAPKPSTGGGAATAAPDDPLSLLPPAPKPAGTAATTTTQETPFVSEYGSPDYTPVAGAGAALGRIGAAAAEGAEAVPHIPRVPGDYITSSFYNPLIAGAETALRLGGGALRGLQQAAVEATPDISLPSLPPGVTIPLGGNRQISGELTPGHLGQEVAALPEAFPFGFNALRPPGRPPIPEASPPGPRFVSELTAPPRPPGMTDAARINQLVEHAVNEEQPAVGPPMARGPATQETPAPSGAGGGGTQPAGAQVTPGYEAIHTPAEEAAYRATAEGKKLLEPQIIGERDTNQYIPGETVNNAEREQTVKTARELKELGVRVPEASDLDKEAAQSNNTARTIYTENTAKGPVEIANRNTQRQADIEADKKTVFAPDNVTGPIDHAPIVDKIQEVLNKPENRQNDAVQTVLRPLIDRLQEEGGAGKISDPREMWGLRQQIDRWTSKRMQSDDSNLHYAAHELGEVSDVMDQQIEKAAPGYDKMIAKYAEHSRAIDEMTVLQGALKNLRGPGQTMTYNDFQRFMKNVVDSRMTPSTDLNAFKAISPENMQRLWNIRDSLRRTASAKELARAAGSDTMPNIIDALKAVGKMGGSAALHAYVGAHLGPGGNLALQSLGAIGKTLNDRRMIRRAMTQMNQLLRPSEPLRVPPGQENALSGAPPPP